jgi:hypothetical protein
VIIENTSAMKWADFDVFGREGPEKFFRFLKNGG